MYLSFIQDIFKKGDNIRVSCGSQEYIGSVVKITEKLLALCLETDSSIKIIRDDEITDVAEFSQVTEKEKFIRASKVLKKLNIGLSTLTDVLRESGFNLPIGPTTKIPYETYELVCNHFGQSYSTEDNADNIRQGTPIPNVSDTPKDDTIIPESKQGEDIHCQDFTVDPDVNYDPESINQEQLLKTCWKVKSGLSPSDKQLVIEANSYVTSTTRHSFYVSTLKQPKEQVLARAIVESALKKEISHFRIGDTLPIIAYKHDMITPYRVILVLSPNSIIGIIDLLYASILEKHYAATKMLCYFLLSNINSQVSRYSLFALLNLLKTINPFLASNHLISSDGHSHKPSRDNWLIEKSINELINKGEIDKAIEQINMVLTDSNIESKYKSSLLLKKAQTYSAQADYTMAKTAYIELIDFNSTHDSSPKNLSHLCTELARLQILTKEDQKTVLDTINRALEYNERNTYASTLLVQIQGGASFPTASDFDKELLIDDESSAPTISRMLDIDIKEHAFTNEEIINRGGKPTAAIAKSILKEAKLTREVDLSERYPIYIEAAKAFSELPIGSYDTRDYLESVSYYAILKGNSLFMRFRQMLIDGSKDINALTRIKDSACSYYIESLNLLSSIQAEHLLTILCNYLKLNINLHNIETDNAPSFSGQFNKVFFNCLKSEESDLKRIAWLTVLTVGAASSYAWNKLNKIKGGTSELISAFRLTRDNYSIINECNGDNVDTSLPPGVFLKQSFKQRKKNNELFGEILNKMIKANFDAHLLGPITNLWKEVIKFERLFLPTDLESKTVVEEILLILGPYNNRNQSERTNLLIQTQRKLENQITFINENTTFYGRTFFFPLFSKWKNSVQDILEEKISQMLPILEVIPDPYYILNDESGRFVNLLIKNVGSSTAEGYEIIATTKDPYSTTVNRGKSSGHTEIAAGANEAKKMNLPAPLQENNSLEFDIEIMAIYQGKLTESRKYFFTVEKEPETTLNIEDIKWFDGPKATGKMFIGRDRDLEILVKHYLSIERDKPYILYGLTRTGKSSILENLGQRLDKKKIRILEEEYTIATFKWDLSEADSYGNAKDMWQYLLYEHVYEELPKYIPKDVYEQLDMPEYPRQKHLSEVLLFLKKQRIYPIFYVDEFSFIKTLMDSGTINSAFLHSLRQFALDGYASFIYAGTYDIKKLIRDSKYGITGQLVNSVDMQINKIDSESAEELMKVMKDDLIFTDEAISHIHKLSGDIPFFIQTYIKTGDFTPVE